ncbi:LANO_0H01134g1_1 [Lachancea nothofagi CBS 11611]|uniref:Ras modification protein ERF4 n=1 Tax=Lachancea nothofagi CBS 11611 TaxID=1266666 RepID=A0A1G4KKZ9_9SACH|nr:LANO_0H01134g1_1 [Lachancea nothofagi CBS 11611]
MDSTLVSLESKKDNLEVSDSKKALFFNYHEFCVTSYSELGTSLVCDHSDDEALCITHFPNVYVPIESVSFKETRLVRIPRRFESYVDIPNFSTQLPGKEPAALVKHTTNGKFVAKGIYQGQAFGMASVSPLSDYLSDSEFKKIIETINEYLYNGFHHASRMDSVNAVLDTLTFQIWNSLLIRATKSPLLELEEYVQALNKSAAFQDKNLRLISPKRSGFLSVCYQKFKDVAKGSNGVQLTHTNHLSYTA